MLLTRNLIYYLQFLRQHLTVFILVYTMTLLYIPCINIFKCDLCQVLLIIWSTVCLPYSQIVSTAKILAAHKHLSPLVYQYAVTDNRRKKCFCTQWLAGLHSHNVACPQPETVDADFGLECRKRLNKIHSLSSIWKAPVMVLGTAEMNFHSLFLLCFAVKSLTLSPDFNNSPTLVNSLSLKKKKIIHRRQPFLSVIVFYFPHYYTHSNLPWRLNTSQIISMDINSQ